ncbi:MAG TPA: hypothetical protein PLX59_00355 [Candidatus Cloacimonadota bacterium]|nr:hypothetical protein [Candidatus Cloacimonadota bacterium]
MNFKHLLLLVMLSTLFFAGCESGSHIYIKNRTNHPLSYRLSRNDPWITLGGGGEVTFKVDTDTQSILTGDVLKDLSLFLVGETYQIYNYNTLSFTDSTRVTVQAGKTYKIFVDPNRASVKIINNSPKNITQAEVFRHNGISPARINVFNDIAPGESLYYHVNHSMPIDSGADVWIPTPATNFFYYVVLTDDENHEYTYGGAETILYKDQQLLVNYQDVE